MSYDNQVFLGIISQCGSPSYVLSRKVFLSPSVWARRVFRVLLVLTDRVEIG